MAMTATLARVPLSRDLGIPQRAADPWPRLATGVLDLLEQAVLVVGRDCNLLGANRVGGELLREGDGISEVRRNIVASTPSANLELRRGIELTARGEGRRMQVPRRGRAPLSLTVEPHPVGYGRPGAAVVFVNDPERSRESGLDALSERYGFTPTEREVAQQLAAGAGLSAIAEMLGITLNTVRGHLKHLYAMAGVHRLAVLVAKLLSAPLGA
jgi:DNA-binding CsgD family transcriptional regulator